MCRPASAASRTTSLWLPCRSKPNSTSSDLPGRPTPYRAHHSSKRRCVGRPYFLAQPKLGQIRPPTGSGGELVEGPPLARQLPVHVRGGGQVGNEQVRRGDDGSYTLAVESGQRLQRLGHRTGAVIHAGDQMAVQVDDGKRGLVLIGHAASLRQRSGQQQGGPAEGGRVVFSTPSYERSLT